MGGPHRGFYTGLPSWIPLMTVFDLVTPYLPSSANCKLTPFEQLMVFLLKIRLNLANQAIGYCFNIHSSTVSRIHHKVLDVMSVRLEHLLHWPSCLALCKSMPTAFMKFYHKCCIIIDCTEIFIEQPSDLLARAQTSSQYKHHNTIKLLIGITPQGTVSFLSKCWGGRVSDKEITETSGLIHNLESGDIIIADRGFTIDNYCRLAMSEVYIPPFTRSKAQLTKKEVDWSRELSVVRIHVERVIRTVKQKYTILQGTLLLSMVGGIESKTATQQCIRSGILESKTATQQCSRSGILESKTATQQCSRSGILESKMTTKCSRSRILESKMATQCSRSGILEPKTTTQ